MWVRTVVVAAGIAVLVVIGVVIGRVTSTPQPPPQPTGLLQADNDTDDGQPVPGTREVTGVNKATGAELHLVITPANGWLGIEVVSATVSNGKRCRLFAYDRAGHSYEFGGWVQSARPDFPIYGAVMMAPADLTSISVVDDAGGKVVTAQVPPP
jgi:hypothetical protein